MSPVRASLTPMTGDDVAGFGDVDRIAVGGVHLEHAADVFALVAVAVEHAAALFELAAVDADVGQIAVLIVDDLERQAAERLVRCRACGR